MFLLCLNVYAQEGFFDSGVDFFGSTQQENKETKKEECVSCQLKDSQSNLKPRDIPQEMKDMVKKIRKNVSKTTATQSSVYLFISPKCRNALGAIKQLEKFKSSYPQWEYEVYMLSSMKEYKVFIKDNKNIFENEILFTLDIQAKVAQRFKINQAPTFVIQYEGEYFKIAGQPILKEVIQKLVKR